MEILCTRPNCPRPNNDCPDLDNTTKLKTVQQKFCTCCGMPLILGGRYLPTRLLGRGGFGAAFLARDRDKPSMKPCVVKQFTPSDDLSPKALQIARDLFQREAEVLEQLGSENEHIPDLYAFFSLTANDPKTGKDDDFFYLVQKYIDGENLEEELERKGQFTEAEVRYVLEEMLKVLKFVHENGSIHRDIKPSNIMRNTKNRLYLLDFGAVKQVTTAPEEAAAKPNRSTGIYTPGYAPPEQIQGAQVYPCTDLYALAATCLHLLTGKPPEDLYDPFHNAWNWESAAPKLSPSLSSVFNGMLQTAAKDRIQSAQEALDLLNEVTATPAVVVPVIPTVIQTPDPVQPIVTTPTGQTITPDPATGAISTPSIPKAPRFSLLEILIGAAFTGFNSGFATLAIKNIAHLTAMPILFAIAAAVAGLFFFLQYTKTIEGKDLLIITAIAIGLAVFIQALNNGQPLALLMASLVAGALCMAVTALFRLIYQLISRVL